jgi:hypothetical protein
MGAVFISYRRGDSEGQARALSIELEELLGGKDSVFMDVDSIALGRDFRQVLQQSLQACDVMLALIGPNWLEAKDAAGNRRLDNPTDFVRQEIASALKRNIAVTPVLLQGASIPSPERLPEDLKDQHPGLPDASTRPGIWRGVAHIEYRRSRCVGNDGVPDVLPGGGSLTLGWLSSRPVGPPAASGVRRREAKAVWRPSMLRRRFSRWA